MEETLHKELRGTGHGQHRQLISPTSDFICQLVGFWREGGAEEIAEAAGCRSARGWHGVTPGWMSHAPSPEVINSSR